MNDSKLADIDIRVLERRRKPQKDKILYEASTIKKENDKSVQFVFANLHGPYEGKKVFPFNNLKDLDVFLLEKTLISETVLLNLSYESSFHLLEY